MDRRVLLAGPLALAAAAGGGFYAMLRGMQRGTVDPRATGNPLVGHPVPEFNLPAQAPAEAGFGSADLRRAGGPVVLNFFASWCQPCLVEHPVLMALRAEGVAVWGVAYHDEAARVAALLARWGDPYSRLARDEPGRVAIDFGITGVPETFVVNRAGVIAWRFPGPLTPALVERELRPALRDAA